MSNYHLRDRNLSYKAKGLLSFMLSLPEDWDYSLAGLCSISKESRDGIRSILKELQEINKEIENLKNSIDRRKKLLSNSGYINNAPKNLVDEERKKLENEEIKLKSYEEKLNK